MNDSVYQQLREQSWRRKLSAEEESQLQEYFFQHPEAQADWELEASLNQQLSHLSDAPVPSNFTSLVMQAIDREISDAARAGNQRPGLWHWLHRWAPRVAWTGLALTVVALAFVQYQSFNRAQFARSVEKVSAMASLPNLELFEDFDAIHRIGQVTPNDAEVLAALQ